VILRATARDQGGGVGPLGRTDRDTVCVCVCKEHACAS